MWKSSYFCKPLYVEVMLCSESTLEKEEFKELVRNAQNDIPTRAEISDHSCMKGAEGGAVCSSW